MSDDFLARIKEMKQKENKIDAEVKAVKKAWEEHMKKHKAEGQKIMEMLNPELKKVVEVFTDPSAVEYDNPSLKIEDKSAYLNVPIVRDRSHINFGISFSLKLTENGYGLNVYGAAMGTFIEPPVTANAIEKEIEAFLSVRNREISRMVEAQIRYLKERS